MTVLLVCDGAACPGYVDQVVTVRAWVATVVADGTVAYSARNLCFACWKAAGEPEGAAVGDVAAMERKVRDRMLARGGADRYRVRAGKTGL